MAASTAPTATPVIPCCEDMRVALAARVVLLNGNRAVLVNTPLDKPLRMCPYCGTAL